MKKPQPGEYFEAYFGCEHLSTSRVVEWCGARCFFANGYYLVWGGESVGFYF